MEKVLLTGATGFIGRHCLEQLKNVDVEIHALSREKKKEEGVVWHQIDLLKDDTAFQLIRELKVSHFLHMAWNVEPKIFWTAADNLQWLNLSIKMLHAFAESGGKRVVMAGTCAEYDWRYGWCSEAITPLNPQTLYGVCKNSLQEVMSCYCQQLGISSSWGRIFYLFGPYENSSRLFSSVISSLLYNKSVKCTEGTQVRDFLHVSDVASAFVKLLSSDMEGPVNIASGSGRTIREVITNIGVYLGKLDLVKFGEITIPYSEPPHIVADTRRLMNEMKWHSDKSFEERLHSTIQWWESELLN